MEIVGTSVARAEGWPKVTGAARYVDDYAFDDILYARTIRSNVAAGSIDCVELDFDPTGFVIVDCRDIPGRNVVALIADDQPCLADGVVRHQEEPILLLAHADRDRLRAATVRVTCTPAPPVYDPLRSTHVFKEIRIEKGRLEEGFDEADLIVEGEYRTGHQEQLYIETNGVIAVPEEGGITVYGSLQCPYYVHRALCVLMGLPPERVRVVQTETGGGFGGKEEYPSIIAGHAALLAWKAGRPVKLVYDRLEDMVATTKRHPSIVRHRTGATRDGRITAMDIDVLLDGGAYMTLSPVVLSRGCLHATGPYRCDHVLVHGRTVMTNTPPNGAFRGFGAPQTQFAVEAHMDRIADALGLDPVTLRERNAFRPGDTTATGQRLGEDCSALDVLREAVRRTDFPARRRTLAGTGSGIGLSLFFHGAGFTGSGEVKLASRATLALTPDGRVDIRVSSTEIGQGTRTILAQIVAEALAVPFDAVSQHDADTRVVPDSGPTVASRTCMVVGAILQRCAQRMRETLGDLSPSDYVARHGPFEVTEEYVRPPGLVWDEETYRGDAYGTYGYACDVVELSVDPDTWEVALQDVTSVHETGTIVNPVLAHGQIEGGTVQGLGMALLEEVVMRDGRMTNAQLTNYIIPTSADIPPVTVGTIERRYAYGPFGAKGLGEMPIDGPAAAAVNALRHAGYDIRSVPATPERIMEAACVSR
jgi:CO/xanthine dehydrogenase Mo-binding subunit